MPPLNQAIVFQAGAVAISVALATAIAVYELPELRRLATDLRHRVAIALHSLRDNVDPCVRKTPFDRPEDAEGFLTSCAPGSNDVNADEETRRHQREELIYWNAVRGRMDEEMRTIAIAKASPGAAATGSTFDDILQQDGSSRDNGAHACNSGMGAFRSHDERLVLRRRGCHSGNGSVDAAVYANPLADEHGVDDLAEVVPMARGLAAHLSLPDKMFSANIYKAAEPATSRTMSPFDVSARPELIQRYDNPSHVGRPEPAEPELHLLANPSLDNEFVGVMVGVAGQGRHEYETDRDDIFTSIQAWAQRSSSGLYSSLPASSVASLSEPGVVSDGALFPVDSASVSVPQLRRILGGETWSDYGTEGERTDDISDEERSVATPSWTEIGSVTSENSDAIRL